MTLRLFDLTSDIGIPVIRALIFDPAGRQAYFDLAAGSGCHPVASRAAIRAITEAAQTRVANIAGARDDFDPAEYAETVRTDQSLLIHAPVTGGDPPPGLSERFDLPQLLQHVVQRLWEAGIADIISVRLGGEEMGISVVRVLVPALEDRGPNINWRPGRRALSIIAGLK
jgi:ribosomal protein S12 methylthiotransferase accessory factor